MAVDPGTPRRPAESDPVAELMSVIKDLRSRLETLERGSTLRNASISGGDGLRVLDSNGDTRVSINTTDGAVVAYNGAGAPVARFGPLDNSNPGQYGVEILYNGSWVQVGGGNVDWGNISNKPATYAPSSHGHNGSQITGVVPESVTAQGSWQAYNQNVPGTSFYAVWVGNSSGHQFGRNTSSARYKQNIRRHDAAASDVLKLQPVIYDRKDWLDYPEDEDGNRLIGPPNLVKGAVGEYGLIAEQVAEFVPEIVQWYDGVVDGIRYDLLSVALLDVLKEQQLRIKSLEDAFNTKLPQYNRPARQNVTSRRKASAAPEVIPTPEPYEILPPEGVI